MSTDRRELPPIELPAPVADPGWPPTVDYAANPKVDVATYIIDWSWQAASEAEREIITRWAARIEASGFGIDLSWGTEVLGNASAQLSHPIRALMEDEDECLHVVEAKDGKVSVRRDVSESDPIAEELADADAAELLPVAIGAKHYAAAGIDKVELAHFFPEWLLDDIQRASTKDDRSLSYVVQRAWKIGGPIVAADPAAAAKALRDASPESTGMPRRRKQTLILPTAMLAQMEAEAERQDRSRSWLLSAAWIAARNGAC